MTVELDRPLCMPRFPVRLLPTVIARFIEEVAAATGTDPSMTALPVLGVLASCLGTKRAIELKAETWKEYPILWTAVIARSGTCKSACCELALWPLREAQAQDFRVHQRDVLEFNERLAAYEASPPQKRASLTKPCLLPPRRRLVSEITLEAMAVILEDNCDGVLLGRDELAGWIRGFNAYKKGRGGDVEGWLELHRGGPILVDRKGGERKIIHVKRAAVSVTGTIQPGTFRCLMTNEFFESGLAARLLLASPTPPTKRWSDRVVPKQVLEDYRRTVMDLLDLEPNQGPDGPEPVVLKMSELARRLWVDWYDANARRQAEALSDPEAAVLSKIEAAAVRFALIFQLVRNPQATEIDEDAMRRGVQLASWFADEALRIYDQFHEPEEVRERRKIVQMIQAREGEVSIRDWQRMRSHRTSADARAELATLEAAGMGVFYFPSTKPGGGRPGEMFRLAGYDPDTDKRPADESEGEIMSDIDPGGPKLRTSDDGRDGRCPGPTAHAEATRGGLDEVVPCRPEAASDLHPGGSTSLPDLET